MCDKDEQKKQALQALWMEMGQREDALVEEYKKAHKLPSRGIIDTPELRALRE